MASPKGNISKMEMESVFSSKITRSENQQKNNLYDLLDISPANPIQLSDTKEEAYDFRHKTEKHYISQKKSRLKVKTVGEIRKLFEQDVYSYLPNEIENQQNILLRKIREGSIKDDTTRELALNILNTDKPISRSAWQMLAKINPERYNYKEQFVLWEGRYIRVNGSKGGDKKFICRYDLCNNKLHKKNIKRKNQLYKRNTLLKKSLSVKFKPGPLGKKPYLDESHQKFHIGKTQLIDIPKAGLDIYPLYGVGLENNVTKFINSFRSSNGVVSKKWAEFAVSMLGVVKNRSVIQVDRNSCINFDLAYKYEQKRVLMRCGIDNSLETTSTRDDETLKNSKNVIMSEIEDIMHKMLDCVEISLQQDNMYSNVEEIKSITQEQKAEHPKNIIHHKDKQKRKYCELDRLDVTVIKIPEDSSNNEQRICHKEYCNLGCVCSSLECIQMIRNHCGLTECMFKCKCDFFKYKHLNLLPSSCSDLTPGLLNLDTEINLKLAKEEKKFRQTVVVAGEKSILLKALKRNWKASKKYGDFYKNVNLKNPVESNQVLSIVTLKIDGKNIEPWCMVHKLYKCFCKGKFITSVCENINDSSININKVALVNKENCSTETTLDENKNTNLPILRPRCKRKNSDSLYQEPSTTTENKTVNTSENDFTSYCARIDPYKGRKYSNNYYKITNNKILEMEKNDKNLLKRMKTILTSVEVTDESDITNKITLKEPESLVNILSTKTVEKTNSNVLHKTNLATWLEASYKLYKTRNERGKLVLNAPKPGKLALYPWSFLLKRYKDRKNMFLVTKQKPYRIFMAVSVADEILKDCMFIDDIRFSELHKFPLTVRNLLTNATNLENIFYIMYGYPNSWELIGSVTKLGESVSSKKATPLIDRQSSSSAQSASIENFFITKNISELQSDEVTDNDRALSSSPSLISIHDNANTQSISEVLLNENINKYLRKSSANICRNKSETSKWFIMNVENDFTEIQFHKRGFFVKHESILKAISVARKTGKTVRLSTQKCASKSFSPQFGIYAIPDSKGSYVFVGPYETNETLGIETVKTTIDLDEHKSTRGIWITTNKLDNRKVIDNPLSFMPPNKIDYNVMVPIDSDSKNNDINLDKSDNKHMKTQNPSTSMKPIKPITIRKTNGFYHLAPNGALKKVPLQDFKKVEISLLNSNTKNQNSLLLNKYGSTLNTSEGDLGKGDKKELNSLNSNLCSASKDILEMHKPKGGMLVLKPDEINKRVLDANLNRNDQDIFNNVQIKNITSQESTTDIDVPNFLTTAFSYDKEVCSTIVISDDSEVNTDEDFSCDSKECEVWIQCTNIKNVGWIKGKRNDLGLLSFECPGFKPSVFYHKEEAFRKINQVLARKIYIPKHITLEWEVIESAKKLKNRHMLDIKYLNSGYALTEKGLKPILKSVKRITSRFKNKMKNDLVNEDSPKDNTDEIAQSTSTDSINETSVMIQDLEDESVYLENKGLMLWNEAVANKSNILSSISSASDDVKQEMTDTLKNIEMMNEE